MDDADQLRKAFWDNLHNRKQVSANLLGEQDIDTIAADGKSVLRVRVPRAARQDRPVHVGSNPFGATYRPSPLRSWSLVLAAGSVPCRRRPGWP